VSCRHHLALDVSPNGRAVTLNFEELEDMVETCSLDVADSGHKLSIKSRHS
jgi:hypothetical protein